jgi:KTSC domain
MTAKKIRWRNVQSSNILAIGWDDESHMYVRFGGHTLYRYDGVSRQRAVACSRAQSVGRYLNQKIKPNFQAVRIA